MSTPRDQILAIFHGALAAVHGTTCVERFLAPRRLGGNVQVVAVGKAADAMLLGARSVLGEQLQAALLITKRGYASSTVKDVPGITVIEAGHPVPDEASLQAGQAMLDFISAAPEDTQLLFLISGGASSLVDVLSPGISLADLQRANHWLLASGFDIHAVNAVRKHLSMIKGGRLATYVQGRRVLQLLISDVSGDILADIGSGLFIRDESESSIPLNLPVWLLSLLKNGSPAPANPANYIDIETHIVATLSDALDAAALETKKLGYTLHMHSERLKGDAVRQGQRLADELIDGPPCVHIWGGETTVSLPSDAGRGGRNQHLALAAAERLAKHDDIWLLAAGTDGCDGNGSDAGALVDGETILRGTQQGLDPADCLRRADAGSFLEISGDIINTGPTGTNVMDIVIGMKA